MKLVRCLTFALVVATIAFWVGLTLPLGVQAATCSEATENTCVGGRVCKCHTDSKGIKFCGPSGTVCAGGVGQKEIGVITKPQFLSRFDTQAYVSTSGQSINGLILFASNLLNLANIVAGVIVLGQFISMGYMYLVNAGDAGVMQKVSDKLFFVVIGLLVMVASYTIAGLVGLVFFGDASYIIRPTLKPVL